jgi:esterase/lipase
MSDALLYNPLLEGGAFLWEGGPTGVLLIHGYTATTRAIHWLPKSQHCVIIDQERELVNQLTLDFVRRADAQGRDNAQSGIGLGRCRSARA